MLALIGKKWLELSSGQGHDYHSVFIASVQKYDEREESHYVYPGGLNETGDEKSWLTTVCAFLLGPLDIDQARKFSPFFAKSSLGSNESNKNQTRAWPIFNTLPFARLGKWKKKVCRSFSPLIFRDSISLSLWSKLLLSFWARSNVCSRVKRGINCVPREDRSREEKGSKEEKGKFYFALWARNLADG